MVINDYFVEIMRMKRLFRRSILLSGLILGVLWGAAGGEEAAGAGLR